jgi:hypothetical protein
MDRRDMRVGLRKAQVQVQPRLDGTNHMRFQVQYLRIRRCAEAVKAVVLSPAAELRPTPKPRKKSDWMKNFLQRPGPTVDQAIRISNARS